MDLSALLPARAVVPQSVSLSVGGHVPRGRTYGLEDLLRFGRRELGPTQVNCFTGRPVASVGSYAGLSLLELLDDAGFSSQPRWQLKRCVIVAEGADDYQAIFSWSELYNSPIGAGVLVLYEREGQPLDEGLGPLSLISAHDRQLGPRHLRQLRSVQAWMFPSSPAR